MYNVEDFDVIISASEQSGEAGSWFPLIYVKGDAETATYKEYGSLTELEKDYAKSTDAYNAANLMFMQEEEGRPDKIAVCSGGASVLTSLTPYMGKNWRQTVIAGGEFDAEFAQAIETTDKIYFTHFASLADLKAAKIETYNRTVAIVYTGEDVANPEAALVGRTAGYEAGSFTYHSMTVKGVTAEAYSKTAADEIKTAGGNCYVMKNGRIASHGGVVASGEWIDVIDSKDWIVQNIRYDINEVQLNNKKIPYTDAGISKYASATRNRLATAYKMGMIAEDENGQPLYSISFKPRKDTTAADRVSRNYPYGSFVAELAGAIHEGTIKGLVIA